jgi:hypothetical protein
MNVKFDSQFVGRPQGRGSSSRCCLLQKLESHHRRQRLVLASSGKRGAPGSLRVHAFQLFQRSNARYLRNEHSFAISYNQPDRSFSFVYFSIPILAEARQN